MHGSSHRRLAAPLLAQQRWRGRPHPGPRPAHGLVSACARRPLSAWPSRGAVAAAPVRLTRAAVLPSPLSSGCPVRGKKTKSSVSLDELPQGLGASLASPDLAQSLTSDSASSPTATATPKRTRKTKSSSSLADLPQGPLQPDEPPPDQEQEQEDEGPAYPTVVLQARRNMQKFENCVLLTRVGGFYELYFEHADQYGPVLNLKVAQKKTSAGPVSMAGFPFFQLDRFLKALVVDFNCYVAVAEEFPNDPGDKIKSGGLMHDRRVTRIITPGTLIDENFIDPYANNYVMAIHVAPSESPDEALDESPPCDLSAEAAKPPFSKQTEADSAIGLAWLDVSTGQFYTQSTTVSALSSILSRVAPREIVVDEILESQKDHSLFSVLAEDKHLITFAPQGEHLPIAQWTPMLESGVPRLTAESFTQHEVCAGSLILQYVKNRLQGLSMKLQPPQRHEALSVMTIDKNSMRSLEVKQTIRDGAFRGSLLHAIRRTVTKGGARLLNTWISAPSTSLETIQARLDLVESFIKDPDLGDEITQLLRRSHDSQRLVQKFAFGRGDPDDMLALANTIHATRDIVDLLQDRESSKTPSTGGPNAAQSPFAALLARIKLEDPIRLATRIGNSIDEDGLDQQHQAEEGEASQLAALAEEVVATEGPLEGDAAALPKGVAAAAKKKRPLSIRDHYADDNMSFVMKPGASEGLTELHERLQALLREKEELGEALRTRHGTASLTLRWTPNLGHICHVRGVRDTRALAVEGVSAVGSSRSTCAFHAADWTELGQRLHQTRFQVSAAEQALFADLRAAVVVCLVKLRRNAAVLDELDVATSFARLAAEQDLVRPVLSDGDSGGDGATNSGSEAATAAATSSPPPSATAVTADAAHTIIGGRHPTVEGGLRTQGRSFTKNDCLVGTPGQGRLWLITGPNMAGKSTYLRQVALITILAQAGSYVPADHAAVCGLVDAIFSRVGSADNLYADQSTFMVEMLETSHILRHATPRSLVIMDEVGRGTTPEDGAAVAYAALDHLARTTRCRALFATHFHALADLASRKGLMVADGGPVEAYCTDVAEDGGGGGGFVYVHRLRKGVNRRSHALKVARLADMPASVVAVAREVLAELGADDE